MLKTRRAFTREFKAEAVRRVTEQDHSLAEVGRDLEIGESTLRSWKQALATEGEHAFPGKGNAPALEEELRRLRDWRGRPRCAKTERREALVVAIKAVHGEVKARYGRP